MIYGKRPIQENPKRYTTGLQLQGWGGGGGAEESKKNVGSDGSGG